MRISTEISTISTDFFLKKRYFFVLFQAICDADFKERHDLALRNISDLRNEIDSLRAEIRDRNLEINDLEADENTLRNQLDQRLIDIERLKNDLASLLTDN